MTVGLCSCNTCLFVTLTLPWIKSGHDHQSGEKQTFLHSEDVEFKDLKLECESKVVSVTCTGSVLGSLLRLCRTRWLRFPFPNFFI